jgi:hypothetical protein
MQLSTRLTNRGSPLASGQALLVIACWDVTFFQTGLLGRTTQIFLHITLPDYLENMPLASCRQLYFMHDDAPAHFSISASRHLNAHYPGRWIGWGGPIAWPWRSPDLNPLDFYLRGHVKSRVFDCCWWCTNSSCAHCSCLSDSTHYTRYFWSWPALIAKTSEGLYSGRRRSLWTFHLIHSQSFPAGVTGIFSVTVQQCWECRIALMLLKGQITLLHLPYCVTCNLNTCVIIVPGVSQFIPEIRMCWHALSKCSPGQLYNHSFRDPCCHTLFIVSLYEKSIPEVLPLSSDTPCIVFLHFLLHLLLLHNPPGGC